jgi:steroid delta-isomerase-like uncharacterized protein
MATAKSTMTEAQMRTVAETVFRAWNAHDVEGILEHLTDDVIWAEPSLVEPARGKEAVTADLKDSFSTFPDLSFEEEDFHVFPNTEQGAFIVTWTLTGTMTGSSKATGLPATGKQVRISGTQISRVRGNLIYEYVIVYDMLNFLQQLGALPKSDGLGFKALVMADVLAGRAEALAGKAVKVVRR